jgi:hypothetical protein
MIDLNIVLLDLENSDIEAVSFEGTKTKYSFFEEFLTPPI